MVSGTAVSGVHGSAADRVMSADARLVVESGMKPVAIDRAAARDGIER